MMYRSLPITAMIIFSLIVPVFVIGQCCDVPNGDPYYDNMITWDGVDIQNDTVTYNGTLFVDGHMRIVDSTVIFEGKGLVLNSTGTLEVINSTLRSSGPETGFYLDLMGYSNFDNVILDGCIDVENGYFGLYVDGELFKGRDLVMRRSGMIRLDGGDIELHGSVINGIMSYSGNMTMVDSLIELTGVTQYGPGTVDLSNVTVTSNMSFSQTAGISSLSLGNLILENVIITGSFNAGISVVYSSLSMNDTLIDLTGGIFGIRGTDSELRRASNIKITGTGTGIELFNCSMELPLVGSEFNTTTLGLSFKGNSPVEVLSTTVRNALYGMTSSAPLDMKDVELKDVQVGVLLENGPIVEMDNCTFDGFGQWAIEDETWESREYDGNHFLPSNTSVGEVAWWGWTEIEVLGPDRIPVTGAEIILESSLGSRYQVQGPQFGAIWGYLDNEGIKHDVTYEVEVKWGTATMEMNFTPAEDQILEIHLPMTDLSVESVEYDDGSLMVTIHCDGSEAREAEIELFIDGKYYDMFRTSISEGEEKTIDFDIEGIEDGKHDVSVRVSSNEEYSGMDGYLQSNNQLSDQIEIDREDDNGMIYLLIFGSAVAMILFLIAIIFVQRRD